MKKTDVPPLIQRELQAEVLGPVFEVLAERLDKEQALDVIKEAMATAAFEAGRKAALAAPERPCLEHFAQCMQTLAMGGQALQIQEMEIKGNRLTYQVSRCAYLDRYAEMGLPLELGHAISCARDGAFARGYHAELKMERPACIGRGDSKCEFLFTWT
jgi:predicted hydrocarbon binding protein